MSLGGLLSIGRALGRVPARPTVYRDVEGLVPRFGSARFGGVGTSSPDAFGGRGEAGQAPAPREEQPRSFGGARPLAEPGTPAPPTEQTAKRRGGHGGDMTAPHLVQSELALMTVRVIRNDLSADGLELIPRPGASVGGMTLRPERPKSVVTRGGWRAWLAHWRQWWRGSAR